jgi:hypothetical protein
VFALADCTVLNQRSECIPCSLLRGIFNPLSGRFGGFSFKLKNQNETGGAKMTRKGCVWLVVVILCCGATAMADMTQMYTIQLLSRGNAPPTPIFMENHMGESEYIEGFTYTNDIYLGDIKIGTESGTITVLDPPLNIQNPFTYVKMDSNYSFPDLGELTAVGYGVGLSNPSTFTFTMSWSASMSSGQTPEALADFYGVNSGSGEISLIGGGTPLTENILWRLGFK